MGVFPGTVKPADAIPDELRAPLPLSRGPVQGAAGLLGEVPRGRTDESSSPPTRSGRFRAIPRSTPSATQPPFYVLLGDEETLGRRSGWPARWWATTANSSPLTFRRIRDPKITASSRVLQLPTDTLTQGPQQIQNSMISDTRVASERTLLERSNRIHYGNLLTLPIADGGVLYVEPLYTERISTNPEQSTFPQLSRVLVSFREPAPAVCASDTRRRSPRRSTRCSAPAPGRVATAGR